MLQLPLPLFHDNSLPLPNHSRFRFDGLEQSIKTDLIVNRELNIIADLDLDVDPDLNLDLDPDLDLEIDLA